MFLCLWQMAFAAPWAERFPLTLDSCAHCPAQDINPAHALCHCPATLSSYVRAGQSAFLPSRLHPASLLDALLGWDTHMDWDTKVAHIWYVYQVFRISAGVTDLEEDSSVTAVAEIGLNV